MERIDQKETHDFMNVQSFSELPFIRPATVNTSAAAREKPIRLFGIEFEVSEESVSAESTTHNGESSFSHHKETVDSSSRSNNGNSGNHNRKFECHYCFRNFPTSQALGGHQNAHKRERQHAKRAHLQADVPFCGLFDYGRLSSAWNSARVYGTHAPYAPGTPLNGSPLGVWRVPPAATPTLEGTHHRLSPPFTRDRPSRTQIPLFGGSNDQLTPLRGGGSAGTYRRYVCESQPGVRDHVSLDLHL